MQLILESESPKIQVKMSALEEESLSEKSIVNSITQELNNVPNGNKENIQTVNNIITQNEENGVNIEKIEEDLPETPLIDDIKVEEKILKETIEKAKEEEKSRVSNIALVVSDENGEESTIVPDSTVVKFNSEVNSEIIEQDESEITNQEINESKDILQYIDIKSLNSPDEGKCHLNECEENVEKIVETSLEIDISDKKEKENHCISKKNTSNEDLVIFEDRVAEDNTEKASDFIEKEHTAENEDLAFSKDIDAEDSTDETPAFIEKEHPTENEYKEQEGKLRESENAEIDIDDKIDTEGEIDEEEKDTSRISELEIPITKDITAHAETFNISKENKIPIDIEVESTVPIIENDSALENMGLDINIIENIELDKNEKSTIQATALENISNEDETQQDVGSVSQKNTPYAHTIEKYTAADTEVHADKLECENVSENYSLDNKNQLSPNDLGESLDLDELPVVDSSKKVEEQIDGTIAEFKDKIMDVDVNKEVIAPIQEDIEIIKEPEEQSEGTTAEFTDEIMDVDVNNEVIAPIQEDIQIIKETEKQSEGTLVDFTDEIMHNEVNKEITVPIQEDIETIKEPETSNKKMCESKRDTALICRLSNTLDILSDDDDDPPVKEPLKTSVSADTITTVSDKQCINIDDDDDIMLIDEETTKDKSEVTTNFDKVENETVDEKSSEETQLPEDISEFDALKNIESSEKDDSKSGSALQNTEIHSIQEEKIESQKPLLSDDYLISCKKNLADMTREDLEEFCVLKIVESIVDRINLSDFKNKQKNMAQNLDEYKKKTVMLTKQLRDLQVVLKSVQEEQRKAKNVPVTPLKITRSVGMQVLMTEKSTMRRKPPPNNNLGTAAPVSNNNMNKTTRLSSNSSPRSQKANVQQIPVPRLVPATNNIISKTPPVIPQVNSINPGKVVVTMPNGVRNSPPAQKVAEKRTHNRIQSVTVDLTDDEPPAKIPTHNTNSVRLVSPQNLLAPRPQTPQQSNSPRKVYIPIGGPQNQSIRSGQTIVLKTVPQAPPALRPRQPNQMVRMPNVRMRRVQGSRHPAPLPDAMKQYQSPNWKSLPPAPDLKLSKVENGIVISWKIDGYHEDSYEEISSYQLYAYQETTAPPNTALWKKIGDVKALPLPMACTLTQFMAGFKYYFAVRAVDVRSRLGPFSLPGSILLLHKM